MSKQDAKKAFKAGYYIEDGKVYNSRHKRLKTSLSARGYPVFACSVAKNWHVSVHQLYAYQLFGDKYMEKGIVCRHLNDVKTDLRVDNIAIGSVADNAQDYSRNRKQSKPKPRKKHTKPSKYLPEEFWV